MVIYTTMITSMMIAISVCACTGNDDTDNIIYDDRIN